MDEARSAIKLTEMLSRVNPPQFVRILSSEINGNNTIVCPETWNFSLVSDLVTLLIWFLLLELGR